MEMTDAGRITVARAKAQMLRNRAYFQQNPAMCTYWRTWVQGALYLDNFADAIEQRLSR